MIVNGSCQADTEPRVRLIWENVDTSTAFYSQEIPLSSASPMLLIMTKFHATLAEAYWTNVILNDVTLDKQNIGFSYLGNRCYRSIRVTDSGVDFGTASYDYMNDGSNQSGLNSPNDKYAIPYRIYEIF